jgi:hypothetical protein
MDKKGWIRFPTLSFFGEQLHSLPETDLDMTGSTKMRFFLPVINENGIPFHMRSFDP